MARHSAAIEAVEPAGIDVMPWSLSKDLMIPDTVLSRFGERPVADLKHADRAHSRTINLEWIPGPAPAPIGASDGIAAALHLSQRGKKLSRNNLRRIFLE